MLLRCVVVGTASGLLFAVMDGLINANPLAQRLYAVYRPIARESVNAFAGVAIDLGYGLALAGLFLLVRSALPGPPLLKGVVFGVMLWFLRVLMGVVGQWMMFKVPAAALVYTLVTGLAEMIVLGALYGVTLSARLVAR